MYHTVALDQSWSSWAGSSEGRYRHWTISQI